jgi:Phage derived protein Gp49-like (DUF891)
MSESPKIIVAYRGRCFTIEYARQANGRLLGLEFFNALEPRWRARIFSLYKRLGDIGSIENREMFRKEEAEFFVFKAFRARLLCYFRQDQRVVITHGFDKKADRTRKQQFDRAARIKQEYEDYLNTLHKRK